MPKVRPLAFANPGEAACERLSCQVHFVGPAKILPKDYTGRADDEYLLSGELPQNFLERDCKHLNQGNGASLVCKMISLPSGVP